MSPVRKDENGNWKIDRPSLLSFLITLVVGGFITFVGSYYGWKYTQIDHGNRIVKLEILGADCAKRIEENEKYIVGDKKDTEWFKLKFQEIAAMLSDIRNDQVRRKRLEMPHD